MNLLERIKELIGYSNLSLRAFCNRCGISQPTLDKQVRGLRGVSLETVLNILSAFPDLSAEWLMRGTGEMFQGEKPDINVEKINKLIDTIATLQEAINAKSETIRLLTEKIKQLENKR
ncbi:MAG: helix-turn-helix domain-containing protein [Muribaculaceae bacterium]|nr:helix-turn-helix domain-containing protein [Muribaculaceae bacterium]